LTKGYKYVGKIVETNIIYLKSSEGFNEKVAHKFDSETLNSRLKA